MCVHVGHSYKVKGNEKFLVKFPSSLIVLWGILPPIFFSLDFPRSSFFPIFFNKIAIVWVGVCVDNKHTICNKIGRVIENAAGTIIDDDSPYI